MEPDERAHAGVLDVAPRLVAVRVEAARAMVRVETTRTYVAHQCASIEEYGVRFLGVSQREARDLADLGRALDAEPTAAVVAAVESARAADGTVDGGTAAAGAASPATLVAALGVGQVQTLGVTVLPTVAPFLLFAAMAFVLIVSSRARQGVPA